MSEPLPFRQVVEAAEELARSYGHVLGAAVTENVWEFARPCNRCDRWLSFSLAPNSSAPSITGRCLARCLGKTGGPLAAQPGQRDGVA
jgi:hypothetical protein